ncbi:uncharacterized protein TNCV_3582661 [Trichonephila clavipes]|nr:uncharacterized protein TNCV_3582661 [Trichonephila clavipes]
MYAARMKEIPYAYGPAQKKVEYPCTRPTPGVMIWGEISDDKRSTFVVIPNTPTAYLYASQLIQPIIFTLINSIQRRVFQHDNAHSHTTVVTLVLQSVEMLPWPARSPVMHPI